MNNWTIDVTFDILTLTSKIIRWFLVIAPTKQNDTEKAWLRIHLPVYSQWVLMTWWRSVKQHNKFHHMVKHELWVESLKARVESLKARVKIQKCEFKSTSYEFKSTSYEFKSTSSRIIKSMKTQVNSLQIYTRN